MVQPLFILGAAVRRRLALDRIHLPREITLVGLVAGFLVPGLAVYIRGPRLWGRAALAGCGLLLLFFIVWFGHPAGNFAFGLLLSIHVTGFVYYCSPLLCGTSRSVPAAVYAAVFDRDRLAHLLAGTERHPATLADAAAHAADRW